MKNKKLLSCQFSTEAASFKAKKSVLQNHVDVPKGQESEPVELEEKDYALTKNREKQNEATEQHAKVMLESLKKDFGNIESNKTALDHGLKIEEAMKKLKEAKTGKNKDAIQPAYNYLQQCVSYALVFVNNEDAKEKKRKADIEWTKAKNEIPALEKAGISKLNTAIDHFLGKAVKEKTEENLYKVVSDYIFPWWNSLTDIQQDVIVEKQDNNRNYRDKENIRALRKFPSFTYKNRRVLAIFTYNRQAGRMTLSAKMLLY